MQFDTKAKKRFILISCVFIGIIIIASIIYILNNNSLEGGGKIGNYEQETKLPVQQKENVEESILNAVNINLPNGVNTKDIRDIIIRQGSGEQTHNEKTDVYTGSFIIDIASLKQSYLVSYQYTGTPDNLGLVSGSPIAVKCLPADKLIYGDFKCTDMFQQQSEGIDPIIGSLPYDSLSFSASPGGKDTQDRQIIIVKLDIPQIDLKGNAASKREVVQMYKKEFTDWVSSKGLDSTSYTIEYNYTDEGKLR